MGYRICYMGLGIPHWSQINLTSLGILWLWITHSYIDRISIPYHFSEMGNRICYTGLGIPHWSHIYLTSLGILWLWISHSSHIDHISIPYHFSEMGYRICYMGLGFPHWCHNNLTYYDMDLTFITYRVPNVKVRAVRDRPEYRGTWGKLGRLLWWAL